MKSGMRRSALKNRSERPKAGEGERGILRYFERARPTIWGVQQGHSTRAWLVGAACVSAMIANAGAASAGPDPKEKGKPSASGPPAAAASGRAEGSMGE